MHSPNKSESKKYKFFYILSDLDELTKLINANHEVSVFKGFLSIKRHKMFLYSIRQF